MATLTKQLLKKLIREELKDARMYWNLGLNHLAKDEDNHADILKHLLEEKE